LKKSSASSVLGVGFGVAFALAVVFGVVFGFAFTFVFGFCAEIKVVANTTISIKKAVFDIFIFLLSKKSS
jgi:hypothetical protein